MTSIGKVHLHFYCILLLIPCWICWARKDFPPYGTPIFNFDGSLIQLSAKKSPPDEFDVRHGERTILLVRFPADNNAQDWGVVLTQSHVINETSVPPFASVFTNKDNSSIVSDRINFPSLDILLTLLDDEDAFVAVEAQSDGRLPGATSNITRLAFKESSRSSVRTHELKDYESVDLVLGSSSSIVNGGNRDMGSEEVDYLTQGITTQQTPLNSRSGSTRNDDEQAYQSAGDSSTSFSQRTRKNHSRKPRQSNGTQGGTMSRIRNFVNFVRKVHQNGFMRSQEEKLKQMMQNYGDFNTPIPEITASGFEFERLGFRVYSHTGTIAFRLLK